MLTAQPLFSWPTTFALIGAIIALYYVVLFLFYRKRLMTPGIKSENLMVSSNNILGDFPSALIDRPIDDQDEEIMYENERIPEDEEFDNAQDDESVLLKEAERVVEEIQTAVTNIASNPPNPEEVFSKLRAIVSQYRIFENTQYFDAINSFVAITVERDCKINYTAEELQSLWN